MKNNKYNTLLVGLYNSTLENRISWQKTGRQNEFNTEISIYTVSISILSQGTFSITREKGEKYALILINADGDQIDMQEFDPTDDEYKVIVSLYAEARRSYYNVDEVLDTLIDELK